MMQKFLLVVQQSPTRHSRELSICMTDDFSDGKTSNIASSPRRSSGPLYVVELGGPTDDKFDACVVAHMNEIDIPTVLESSVMQIKSSPVTTQWLDSDSVVTVDNYR